MRVVDGMCQQEYLLSKWYLHLMPLPCTSDFPPAAPDFSMLFRAQVSAIDLVGQHGRDNLSGLRCVPKVDRK
jgi:hypothetical protein